MPKIAAYQRSTVQTAAPSVRATSSPGVAIGQAGANLGEALSGLANTMIERKAAQQKEDQYFATQRIGRIATDSATDFEVAFKQRLETDAYNSGDAVDKWTVDTTDKLLDIPDEKVRFQVNDHIQTLASKLKDQLAGHEASQRKVVSVNAREGTFKSTSKAAYQGFGSLDDNLAIINKAVANDPTMGQIEKENTLIAYQSGVAESYLDGVVSRSPLAATELIKSGAFNKYLTKEKLEEFDTKIKPKLAAHTVDGIIGQLSGLMPKDLDAPFEMDVLTKKVNEITEDPEIRKLVRTELKAQAADRSAAAKERFDYNYGKIADAWEVNPKLKTTDIMKMPEFTNLTTAQQGTALAKIRQKIEHRDTTERTTRAAERSAAAAERSADAAKAAATQKKYDEAYYYYRSRPELFASMPEDEFKALRMEMGDKQFAHLQDDRKKASSPEALRDATVHSTTINNVLDQIPGIDDQGKSKYFTKSKSAIAAAQKRKGAPLSPTEVQAVVVENMQLDFVKEKGLFGSKKLKRKFDVNKTDTPVPIPEDINAEFDALERKRGKPLSAERRRLLYIEKLKEAE